MGEEDDASFHFYDPPPPFLCAFATTSAVLGQDKQTHENYTVSHFLPLDFLYLANKIFHGKHFISNANHEYTL